MPALLHIPQPELGWRLACQRLEVLETVEETQRQEDKEQKEALSPSWPSSWRMREDRKKKWVSGKHSSLGGMSLMYKDSAL